jgi:Family of unknown function (DUF6499)
MAEEIFTKKKTRFHIADWRDTNQYPAINGTTKVVWAWEFLRRSRQYGNDYFQWYRIRNWGKAGTERSDLLKKLEKRYGKQVTLSFPGEEYLPSNLRDSVSLQNWKCYPSATPSYMTVCEYKKQHGNPPIIGIRRDIALRMRWGITQAVSPHTNFTSELVKFENDVHKVGTLDLTSGSITKPRNANVPLMPYEVAIVFDLSDYSAQLTMLKQQLDEMLQDKVIQSSLGTRRKTTKHQPEPQEMWVMLRFADFIREHQIKTGVRPSETDSEFVCERLPLTEFLKVIRKDGTKFGGSIQKWLDESFEARQLKNWRVDHLVRLVCYRGYKTLLT